MMLLGLNLNLDVTCGVLAMISGVCLGLRAYMLKPKFQTWQTAPSPVWLTLWLLSLAYLGAAFQLLSGLDKHEDPATARELIIYAASAASSVVMLLNLAFQAWTPRTGLEADECD